MTVNDLITAALRRLRVISGADPPSGDDMNDALLRLQDWLDALSNENFLNLWSQSLAWPLVAGKASYEMPGEIPVTSPPFSPFNNASDIENIGYRDVSGNEYNLGPVLNDDAWAAIPNKSYQSRFPSYFYFRGGPGVITPGYKAFLYPWPIPSAPGLTAVMYYGQAVSNMTLATVLDGNAALPPGWRRFLRDGLALELAPEFHVSDPEVLGPLRLSTEESRANIKRKARKLTDLAVPEHFSLPGGGNIYTGS